MAELPATLFAGEATLVVMDEHVVVKAVLPGECCIANQAHKRFNT